MTKGLFEGDLLIPYFIALYIREEDEVESVTMRRSILEEKRMALSVKLSTSCPNLIKLAQIL